MEKVCCILDSDEKFAIRMCTCINRKHVFPFIVQAFSKLEEYISCAMTNQVELLLVDESMYDDVKDISAGQIIRLCEQPMLMEGDDEPCVAKFQASDNIIRDVLYLYNGSIASGGRVMDGSSVKTVCVYSPCGCCKKTTLALAFAHIKGQKKRTLYLNLEEFSALGMPADSATLSDALYYYKTMEVAGESRLLSVVGRMDAFDYVAPAVCAKDLAGTDTDTFIGLIDKLARLGEYELVVVDMGSLIKEPWVLLCHADMILSPAPDSEYKKKRQEEFEKYMYMSGYESVIEKLIQVDSTHDGEMYRDGQVNFSHIQGSRLAKAVTDIDI